MRGHIEEQYIHNLDRAKQNPKPGLEPGLEGQGFPAEAVTLDFFKTMGLSARLSTDGEDEGRQDIGSKRIIDGVVFKDNKAIMSPQITTSKFPDVRAKKMAELIAKPFVRVKEMSSQDTAIPKVLIYLDAQSVSNFNKNPDFNQHPEIALQIIDGSLISLGLVLSKTEYDREQEAVQKLIAMFEQERKKYIH